MIHTRRIVRRARYEECPSFGLVAPRRELLKIQHLPNGTAPHGQKIFVKVIL